MHFFKTTVFILFMARVCAQGQDSHAMMDTLTQDSRPFDWHPIIGSGPETGLQLGIGFLYEVNGADSTRRASFLNGSLAFTFKGYWSLNTSVRYFSPNERYFFQTDLSHVNLPLYFYGIGNTVDPAQKELYFSKTVRVQAIVYKRIIDQFFIGAGYQAGSVYAMRFPQHGMLESSIVHGKDGHVLSGVTATLLYDSRDNQMASAKGLFVRLHHTTFSQTLGSTFNFNTISLDTRVFMKPSERGDVFALQLYAVSTAGNIPFTELALLGNAAIMRGYYPGQYRDKKMIALQAEYRYQLNSWLGAVGFAGAGYVTPHFSKPADKILPSYGGGLRFKLPSVQDLHLRIDYGVGKASNSFYIGLMEAF